MSAPSKVRACPYCNRMLHQGAGFASHLRAHIRTRAAHNVQAITNVAGPPKSAAHAAKRARLAEYVAARVILDNDPPPPVVAPVKPALSLGQSIHSMLQSFWTRK